MEKVIIGFSRPRQTKILSSIIMGILDTPYSHVYIKIHSDSLERDLIYQASGLAVNFMAPAIFDAHNVVVKEFSFDVTSQKKKEILQFCVDNAGVPYGSKELIGLGWVCVNEKLGRKISNPFRDGRASYVCCELGAKVAEDFLEIPINQDLDDLTPKEFYEALEKAV